MLACESKGRWFDSQSGHMPGLRASPPVGVCERQPHIDVSLSLKKKKRFRNTLKRKKAGYQIKISIHFFCDCTGRDHTGLSALLDGTFSRQGLYLQLSLISSYTMPGRVKVREYNKCLLNE